MLAQEIAGEHGIVMLGVTELTTVKEAELRRQLGFIMARLGLGEIPKEIVDMEEDNPIRKAFVHMRAIEAANAGVAGLVGSARELIDPFKSDPKLVGMFTMIPGTRSPGEDTHDQHKVDTPEAAIANGADLLVIGREVTASKDPVSAFQIIEAGIGRGMAKRSPVA